MKSVLSRPFRTDLSYGSLHIEEDRIRGEFFANFVADIIQVRRAGEFVVAMAFPQHFTSDRVIFEVEARDKDGNALNIPYPVWDDLPKWAMWWTVSALGDVHVHAVKPELHDLGGAWRAKGTFVSAGLPIKIPLGVDWRTLCFERPLRKTLPNHGVDDSWPQTSQTPTETAIPTQAWWQKLIP
jgi:hypothetical protein